MGRVIQLVPSLFAFSLAVLAPLAANAQCDPSREYTLAATSGTPESRSATFMATWRDRFRAELTRADLSDDCRWSFRRTVLSLSNGLGDYQDSLSQARLMVGEARTAQQHVEAANHVVGVHVMLDGRFMGPEAQNECVSVATSALSHAPDGDGLFDSAWIVDFDHMLTLRHVVATGIASDQEAMVARLLTLVERLDTLSASPLATPDHRASIASTRCALVRNVVSEYLRLRDSEAARVFIEQQPESAVCSKGSLLLTLASNPLTSESTKRACQEWVAQHSAVSWERSQALYNRGMKVVNDARPGGGTDAGVVEGAIGDLSEASRLASEPGPDGEPQTMVFERSQLAGDAKHGQFILIRTILRDSARATEVGTDFLNRFPDHRNAPAVRSFLENR